MNYKEKIEEIIKEYSYFIGDSDEYNFNMPKVIEELTALYEQAQRDAVEDWMDYLFKEHGEWVELDEARYKNALGQYLNQTKEDIKEKQ